MPDPAECPTCRRGCGCGPTDPGCGHYGCWGRDRTPPTCPGAAAEEARHLAALRAQRAADARTLNRRAQHAAAFRGALHAIRASRP